MYLKPLWIKDYSKFLLDFLPLCAKFVPLEIFMASVQKRLGKDGVRWLARVRRHGHPEQTKTFDTKAAADSWTRAVEREMDTGSFIPSDSATHLTFTKAAERYKAEALPRLRGKAQAEYVVNRVIEHFGKYSLALITPHLLSEYRDVRLTGC